MADETGNVKSLFGDAPVATEAEPRTYSVNLNGGTELGPYTGYLVTNGYIVCILSEKDNADTVKFLTNQANVNYIVESDEVDDED